MGGDGTLNVVKSMETLCQPRACEGKTITWQRQLNRLVKSGTIKTTIWVFSKHGRGALRIDSCVICPQSFWEQHQEQAGNSSENNFILRVCWGQKCIGKIEMEELITVSITFLQQLSGMTWKWLESCHLLCILFPSGRFEGWEENSNKAIRRLERVGERWNGWCVESFNAIFPARQRGWAKVWYSGANTRVTPVSQCPLACTGAACARRWSLQQKTQRSSFYKCILEAAGSGEDFSLATKICESLSMIQIHWSHCQDFQ